MTHALTLLVGAGLMWLAVSPAAANARGWIKRQTWDRVF
jgi:hypothetical protein